MKKTFVLAIIAIFVFLSAAWAGKTIKNAPGGKRTAAQLTNTMAFPLDAGTADYWTDLAEHYAWIKAQTDILYASKPWYDGADAQGTLIKFYGPTVANGGHGTYTALQGGDFVGTEGSGILWRLPLTHPSSGITAIITTDSNGNMAITSVTGNSKYVGTDSGGAYGVFDLPTIPTQSSLGVDDLITLSGLVEGSVNLGEFSGTTITDNQTIKAALQALETALEGIETSGISDIDDLPGDTVDDDKIDVGLIADMGPTFAAATSKTTPVDADEIPLSDSAASGALKALSWENIKATLKTYFDTIYTALSGTSSSTWQVGTGGPKLKNSSGTIEARNAADDAYADIKGKDGYFAHVYSTAADGAYYGNWDNTVAITFTPAQGDFWSETGVLKFRDTTNTRNVLNDNSTIDDDKVAFDDADNLWTAATIGAALEELNDSINAGAPNGTGAKVHYSQLLGVPTVAVTVISGTSALGTSEIASGACASIVTTSATGVATTDVIQWGFNTRPTQVTGYAGANTTGALRIDAYPTADNVNFEVCNQTASAITPEAMTLNWRVSR